MAAVSRHDRGHDGETQPEAVGAGQPLASLPPERLEQERQHGRIEHLAAVDDADGRPLIIGRGFHSDPSTRGEVVANSVLDQVADEALDQGGIADDGRRAELGTDLDAGGYRLGPGVVDHLLGHAGQIDGYPAFDAALGAGQDQQGVDEILALLAVDTQLLKSEA
jgi:hypothetical protein